ncbi:NACHT, LRR and PYD domains-containing 3-like isoform X1 [Solea senegalensis]|uniref:NACHT, LRR and PYD domains-containing 3-like isoform X1 n=1 Tax=Solea senegalensis TaxID=28829 RepID=A0AAV6RVM0_SOLSE|nr:NACHT, LRR and PYD domains-containing 3-like isoform X1 [Solea senegalensis]
MNQIKDSEEEAPPPKTTLCEEHEGQRRIHQQRPDFTGPGPGPSCVSMKSDWSMAQPVSFKQEQRTIRQQGPDSARPGPGPSCVSMKSDLSIGRYINFKDGQKHGERIVDQQRTEVLSGQSVQQHGADLDSIFKLLEENIICFVKNELKKIHKVLDTDHTEVSESQREDEEQRSSREAFLKITEDFLRRMKQEKLADEIRAPACRRELKSNLKKKFQCLFEGVAKAGNPTLLNEIFTELYITEGGTSEVNEEHEVRQIDRASWKPDRPETTIRQEDIFKASAGRDGPIRRVMTKGVAGIGKTVLTQKFTLDWAEDKSNQDVQLMFPFTFRELNVLKEKKFSLVELIHHFFTETKEIGICRFEDFKVVFIFDGLDECRLPLDFHNTEILTDITASTSVDVLLTNLIRGKLLPSARLWITTRPAAANQIPPDCVDMVTEVRGFTDPQKEDYFRKRFRDEEKARRIISHIQTSQSLHIMCHIPVFCWITATVLENMLKTRDGGELPKTLTEMYIHFLVVQSKVKRVKYDGGAETDPHWSPENRKMIESLGKLAFEQLQKGNLIFYESDLTECGIDITAASVYSGVFTQIFKEERGLYQDKVFCFVHLSVQEFLAALHVHLTFITSGTNLLSEPTTSQWSRPFRKKPELNHLHQSAVGEALLSPNGHLDLSLRFLLGLSLETNQKLLRGLLTQTGSGLQTNQETVEYIKKKISENLSAERSINLFHCLNELNHRSLVEEIQESLTSGRLSTETLSPAQWSALVFILLSSGKDLEEFDLKKYSASEEALLKLLPVVKASNKALLSGCKLSERSCEALSSVLSTVSSRLRHVDLSNNDLQDPGVKLLCDGLKSPHCSLETLSLSGCLVSEEGCSSLTSALNSNPSHLRELDLCNNDLQDPGVKLLCDGLKGPHCSLEALRMSGCNLSERSCEALSSVLSSVSSRLRHVDLSNNDLQDPGVKLLCDGLKSPHCSLETLSLSGCLVSDEGCSSLTSALNSNPSHLRELDLSNNDLQDPGVKLLCDGLKSPHCSLETLSLSGCLVSDEGCSSLTSALNSNPSHLRELDLSNNDLQDPGVKLLCDGLKSPHCSLETLSLSGCLVSEEGCSSLTSALNSNPSHLRELDLSYNHPGDSGEKLLSAGLKSPHWRLDTLRMDHAGEQWLKPGLRKYSCELELDTNTMNRKLKLSDDNRKVTRVTEDQWYPDHPDRFEFWSQLLCRPGLTGRCYWEVEWKGTVDISLSYRGIKRKGIGFDCLFGDNDQSWSLICSDVHGNFVHHCGIRTPIMSSVSHRVSVYVDCPAGTLSFYSVSSDSLIHLHTFRTTFTEPVYPGYLVCPGSSVSLCPL